MKNNFAPSDLTSEKSLWDIYKLSMWIYPNKLQFLIVSVITMLLAVNAFVLENDVNILLQNTRLWASTGFSFAISTLGFLITGFTIFATVSKPKMMLAMMAHYNKKVKLPTLKYNFFVFIKVFISYISISLIYLLIILFAQSNGLISNLINLLTDASCIKIFIIKIVYVFVGGSAVHLLLILKSFIFNIYTIVMNLLQWELREIKLSKSQDNNTPN